MEITFNKAASINSISLVLSEEFNINEMAEFSSEFKDFVNQAIKLRNFTGKVAQKVSIIVPYNGQMQQIILIGAGKADEFNILSAIKLGGKLISGMRCTKLESMSVIIENRLLTQNEAEICANMAYGACLRNYKFDKYKSADKLKDKVDIENIEFVTNLSSEAQKLFNTELKPVAKAIHFSRNLSTEPANILYPESFVNFARKELAALNVQIEVLDEAQMQELGMNALLGVGQGSARDSKLLVMQYNGGEAGQAPLAFVGKGVTFDTGGISIKPSARMEDMKYDMCGAAVVTSLIKSLAERGAKVNVVAVAGLVENMPDGNAQRPSDVVRSMSGQTIEIINTDAEGRLVLADALWYTQNRFKPQLMIDLATLTGAIMVALGNHHAGLFSNDENLSAQLLASGKATEEKLWLMPLAPEYDKMIDSDIADVKNSVNGGGAGSTTAAQFLKRFVNDTKWAHLDIAGVSWADKDSDLHPAGATGFGIRLLNDFVRNYEK